MAIVEMNKVHLFDIDSPDNLDTNDDCNRLLQMNGNLQPGGQPIGASWQRIGQSTIDARGAKFARLHLQITANDSTDIDIQLVYGLSDIALFTPEVTNKEVATDLTTRSEAVNRLQAGNLEHSYDFKLDSTFRYIAFQIMAGTVGQPAGQVIAANITLGY